MAFTETGCRATRRKSGSAGHLPRRVRDGHRRPRKCSAIRGGNSSDNWVGSLASPDLHAIAILFARDAAKPIAVRSNTPTSSAQCEGVEVLSTLDLEATRRSTTRVTISATATGFPAGHRGHWRSANARHRRATQAGRSHPRLPR